MTDEELAERLEASFRGLGLSESAARAGARCGRPAEVSPASESLSAEGRRQYELGRSLGLSEAQSLAWVRDLGLDGGGEPAQPAGGGLAAVFEEFERYWIDLGHPPHLVREAARLWRAEKLAEALAAQAKRRAGTPARSSKATVSEPGRIVKVVR